MKESLFLQAFRGTNTRVPVWFMRQAGRALKAYQRLKEKHSLEELFANPELAATVTCLPVTTLGVDAAILFADILTLPRAMGFDIRFDDKKGPVITNADLALKPRPAGDLAHIEQTVRLTLEQLPPGIPLIGFAGSPFTVLAYLVESGSSLCFNRTLRFVHEQPQAFQDLMESLTQNTIDYSRIQQRAGIQAFQLFDSWAGILRPADYARLVLPFVSRIFESVDLPSIYYVKNTAHVLTLMDQTRADFLSVDHTVVLGHHPLLAKTRKGIQGNLFNGCLYGDESYLKAEVRDVLLGAQDYRRYIFNLSHGVLPDTDEDKLKRVVDWVHEFDWQRTHE